jgi:hypothetical protein
LSVASVRAASIAVASLGTTVGFGVIASRTVSVLVFPDMGCLLELR